MKWLLSAAVTLSLTSSVLPNDVLPFVSPGVRLGWNLQGSVTLGFKVSLGVAGVAPGMYNLTFGARHNIFLKPSYEDRTLYYCDVQAGRFFDAFGDQSKVKNLTGGGAGIAYTNNKILPHACLFTGYLLFATADFVYNQRVETDLGVQGVLPIPLKRNVFDIGNPGGE